MSARSLSARSAIALAPLLAIAGCSWIRPSEPLEPLPSGVAAPVLEAIPVEFAHVWDRERALHLSGAAVIDVDADGRFEIFVGGGDGQPDALLAYRGGRLVDRIEGTGLSSLQATYGSASLDLDDDGWVDLVVARNDGVTLYHNRGGRFEARHLAVELPADSVPLAVSLSDIDADGDADLYLSDFVDYPHFVSATFNVPSHAKPNRLLRNDGSLEFTDITTPEVESLQNTFTSLFVDLDGDRRQDLVVAQNTGQVELFRNAGGRFERVPLETGYGFWMGVSSGDFDSDGDQDLFFSNVGVSFPASLAHGDLRDDQRYEPDWLLLRNEGGFRFSDATREMGLSGMGFGWGSVFEDINLDGRLDLLVAQNYVKWPPHRWFKFPGKVLLAGPASAPRFSALPGEIDPSFGNSPVIVDLDADGRQDLFWLNNDDPSRAYLNRSQGDAVLVALPDAARSLGARVRLVGARSAYTREFSTSVGLGTDQSPVWAFAVGPDDRAARIEVEWPDGLRAQIPDPPRNARIEVDRDGARRRGAGGEPIPLAARYSESRERAASTARTSSSGTSSESSADGWSSASALRSDVAR
ncbi:MAG TPA: CRTAC1 family protein [Myxococcota bacterium]|nr:CRTAC1 family protein [Myxococcota bacterium]